MQDVSNAPVQSLKRRVRDLNDRMTRAQTLRDNLRSNLQAVETEVMDLSAKTLLLVKVGELFRVLMDRLVSDRVHAIEKLVTEGLQAIFFDQKMVFEAEIGVKYNKTCVEFSFRQGEGPTAITGSPLEAFGGGPASIASLLLRVMAVLKMKRFPLLVLDETLAAVSDEYVDASGQFLRQLAKVAAVDVLLVTHKASFLDRAHKAYQGTEIEHDGLRSLALREVGGIS